MKATKDNAGFFADRAANRREDARRADIAVQRTRKDGTWGAPIMCTPGTKFEGGTFRPETPEEVVANMARMNPDNEWRVAR